MDIGKIDNYKFYEGYGFEPEVELSTNIETMETLHIWDGFSRNLFASKKFLAFAVQVCYYSK